MDCFLTHIFFLLYYQLGLGLIKCHSGHVQFEARRRWREVDTLAGRVPALLPPGGIGAEPRMAPVPALGEHSAALLAELGYSEADIARFLRHKYVSPKSVTSVTDFEAS